MVFLKKKDKKSLRSIHHAAMMMHTTRVIFMILPLLFVPLVYGMSSTPDACAVPAEQGWENSGTCGGISDTGDALIKTCCWTEEERVPGKLPPLNKRDVMYCQTCSVEKEDLTVDCKDKVRQSITTPFDPTAPLQGGVLEQLQNDQPPPLFGRNEGAVPPTGGIEQPFTSTPFQQIPQGTVQGQDQPFIQSETPPTLSPTPTPPPPLPPPHFARRTCAK